VVVWIPETKTPYVPDVELQNRLETCCTPFKVEVHCGQRKTIALSRYPDWFAEPEGHFFLNQIHPGASMTGKRHFWTVGGLLCDRKTAKKYALTLNM